jgi:hypothetical protein
MSVDTVAQAAERKIRKLLENTNVIGDVTIDIPVQVGELWHVTYRYNTGRHLMGDHNNVKTIKFDANGVYKGKV